MPGQPNAPAGWYPDPNGGQRYWDGNQWLDLPSPDSSHKTLPRPPTALMVSVAVTLLLLVGAGAAWKLSHDADARAENAAIERDAQQAADRRESERAAQERKDSGEPTRRAMMVTSIEDGIKKMADEHVGTGILNGPIISVSCSPVGGGSTDDLTEKTTVFQCFAANQKNEDGTMRGYHYNATMNWTTGSATYGFGSP